jgi:acetyl-CoA carboxylase biotin carboxyl carrier protein
MAKKAKTKKKAVAKKVVAKKKSPAKKVANKKSVAKKPAPAKSKIPANFNIDEITNLLNAVNHSGVNELKLEKGSFKITIRQGVTQAATVVQAAAPMAAAPAPAPSAAPVAPAPAPPSGGGSDAPAGDNLITVKSPMIGTFYRSSSPDKPPFISVGDSIKEGDVLCIVEAMKLFNEIESEVSGTIVKVLVDDTSPVEYDQPLFLVEP